MISRFYPDLEWYVDVSLMLIERAGEFASKEIWHSIVQLITNYPQLHVYAAEKVDLSPQTLCSQALANPLNHDSSQRLTGFFG